MPEKDMQETYVRWLRQAASRPNNNDEIYKHAWEVARKAAQLLKERFGVKRVRVFGSLTHKSRFYPGSDIDLAVEGLKPDDFWEALTSVLFLDDKVLVEMVDKSTCRPEIWAIVEQEGIDL
jgi:predicted nucleotidyltransferase